MNYPSNTQNPQAPWAHLAQQQNAQNAQNDWSYDDKPEIELIPEGYHVAVIVDIVERIETSSFKGKDEKKAVVYFETSALNSDGKRFWLSVRGTPTVSKKSKLRNVLDAVGVKTDEEARRFFIPNLIGNCLQLYVKHHTSQTGNVYAKVEALMPLPPNAQAIQSANEYQTWLLENWLKLNGEKQWLRSALLGRINQQQPQQNAQNQQQAPPQHQPPAGYSKF